MRNIRILSALSLVIALFIAPYIHSAQGGEVHAVIHFRTDSDHLLRADQYKLDAFVHSVKDSAARYLIVGHADERGGENYNLSLGDRRARSALRFLIKSGISTDRLLVLSKGESEPLDRKHTREAWRKNRRVEIVAW